ncbi:MAG: hypothetical protein ACKVQU_18275 [Burkholderiales bacterium]
MNEREALDVLLARAIDTNMSAAPLVSQSVRDACSIDAARACALNDAPSQADIERFIVRRAGLLLAHAGASMPQINRLRTLHAPPWLFATVLLIAFALGLASHGLGDARRINLLFAPMLFIILWNVVIYLALALSRFGPVKSGSIASAIAGLRWRHAMKTQASAFQDVFKMWLAHAAPIIGTRTAVALHSAAALFAVGAIIGMYVRGLGVEYLAGWESTFLDPHAVRRILSIVLSPGSILTGIDVGDVAQITAMRFRDSMGGEPAGPWIHLYAATAGMVILIPRLALAVLARRETRLLAGRSAINPDDPLDDRYVRRLLATVSRKSDRLVAWPVATTLDDALVDALRLALEERLGGRIALILGNPIPYGAPAPAPSDGHDVVLVFASAATPEPEVHGALIEATKPVAIAIDETAMQRRFGQDPAMAQKRTAERRDAWRALAKLGNLDPLFIHSQAQ